jgi:hypothetical protein
VIFSESINSNKKDKRKISEIFFEEMEIGRLRME